MVQGSAEQALLDPAGIAAKLNEVRSAKAHLGHAANAKTSAENEHRRTVAAVKDMLVAVIKQALDTCGRDLDLIGVVREAHAQTYEQILQIGVERSKKSGVWDDPRP